MKLNWFYLLIGVLIFLMLFISQRFFRGSGNSSVGVTHSKEYRINAERPALVKAIHAKSGEQVKEGALLIELTSNVMEVQMAKLENRISVLKSEQSEKAKLSDSEIAYIKADLGIKVENLNSEISQAESELKLNRKLSNEFSTGPDSINEEHPVQMKLKALIQQRARQQEAIAIKVKDILQEKETEQYLLVNHIGLLEKELLLLQHEKKSLNKYSSADGVVENIYVRQGEQVDAFTSLLSVRPVHPTAVIGYLVGKKNGLEVGDSVSVKSYEKSANVANGKVIGYGAVVELPEILQKSTAVKAFGREVFIEIPVKNEFASGEKVLIR